VQRDSGLDTLQNKLLYVFLLNCIHRNLFGEMLRDDDYTIDVAYDDVSGEDRDSAAANGQVHVDGVVGDEVSGGALARAKNGKTAAGDNPAVANRAVGNHASGSANFETGG